MRETFSTHPSKDAAAEEKRKRLHSQGASKKPHQQIDLANVKPPARKVIQEELNQTMQIN